MVNKYAQVSISDLSIILKDGVNKLSWKTCTCIVSISDCQDWLHFHPNCSITSTLGVGANEGGND